MAVPKQCCVTGGSGFVGARLVEMLVERGAERVVSFDIAPKPKGASDAKQIEYVQGDLTDPAVVEKALEGVDCVYHIAALVGPYHAAPAYVKVNYEGTVNVVEACKRLGITRIVMSSSPSTRFPYPNPDVSNLTEEELAEVTHQHHYITSTPSRTLTVTLTPALPYTLCAFPFHLRCKVNGGDFTPVFLQPYAETKAMGEKYCRDACGTKNSDLLTVAVAPHQVYGPKDGLFLPNLLTVAGSGKLRIFGNGENVISFCHVDNYCHGLILGGEALYEGSPALGKFYIVTDGPGIKFWHVLDEAVIAMGFTSLFSKMKLPTWFMMFLAHVVVVVGNLWSALTGTPKHIVNYKLKLNPFAVKMLVINRHFNICGAERDLKYKPIIEFEQGWKDTIAWFKENWLPQHLGKTGEEKTKDKK